MMSKGVDQILYGETGPRGEADLTETDSRVLRVIMSEGVGGITPDEVKTQVDFLDPQLAALKLPEIRHSLNKLALKGYLLKTEDPLLKIAPVYSLTQ